MNIIPTIFSYIKTCLFSERSDTNQKNTRQTNPLDQIKYGHVWTEPARTLNSIIESRGFTEEALCEALSLGYFSQYTCYRNPQFNEKVVQWQIAVLERSFGNFFDQFPAHFEEMVQVPAPTLGCWKGKRLTADLLRNVWYALKIQAWTRGKSDFTSHPILEIGSGSGSLARVLKDLFPQAKIWLVDLPESLNFAAIYLKKTFPKSRFLRVYSPVDLDEDIQSYDFVLLPASLKKVLYGRSFELAVNVWSFGEMPNSFVEDWFRLIQDECQVRFFFTLNAFMPPVTPGSIERINQGDWFAQMDSQWDILGYDVNPEIHRNPWIKNFYTGLCLFAERVKEKAALQQQILQSQGELSVLLMEDWVQLVFEKKNSLARPETEVTFIQDPQRGRQPIYLAQLLSTTEYIGRFNMEAGRQGSLFKLWNHYRLTRDTLSGELLVCFLAMVFKSQLEIRCTKEELQILRRLPDSSLREAYQAFPFTREI